MSETTSGLRSCRRRKAREYCTGSETTFQSVSCLFRQTQKEELAMRARWLIPAAMMLALGACRKSENYSSDTAATTTDTATTATMVSNETTGTATGTGSTGGAASTLS